MLEEAPLFTPLSELGEFGLIQRLTSPFPKGDLRILMGVGDDAAVIETNGDGVQVVTTDLLVEGVHFDRMYTPLRHLGYKAAVVNFSDVYAMNALPEFLTLSVAVSSHYSVEQLEELYAGVRIACEEHKVNLVGGDTSASQSGLFISVTAIGSTQRNRVTYRSGAAPRDIVCVSGDLGGAIAGLMILNREKEVYLSNASIQPDMTDYAYVIERQLKPRARRDVIEGLAMHGVVPSSMIDISDGLASELTHLSRAGMQHLQVYQERLPIDHQTMRVAELFDQAGSTYALYGGEDYELLFTLRQDDFRKVQHEPWVRPIGYSTGPGEGVDLILADNTVVPIQPMGYNHFRPEDKPVSGVS
jgi:thiamine-monophosphate kinase